jgi:hypothetical protein
MKDLLEKIALKKHREIPVDTLLDLSGMTFAIGIDPGVQTGLAIFSCDINKFVHVKTVTIAKAFRTIEKLNRNNIVFCVVEDARKRKGKMLSYAKEEAIQGAGDIKGSCRTWEHFLIEYEIPFQLVAPSGTKMKKLYFDKLVNDDFISSNHSRDAAVRVLNYTKNSILNRVSLCKKT